MYKCDLHPYQLVLGTQFIFRDKNPPTAYASPGSLVIPASFYFTVATFYSLSCTYFPLGSILGAQT
jgi:hypothetical protein